MGGSGGDGGFGWWWWLVDGGVDGRVFTRSTLREVGRSFIGFLVNE